jgi:3-dehydroquinate dehydratase-2
MQLRSQDARPLTFAFINGPNMGRLGRREGAIFGPVSSLEHLNGMADEFAKDLGVSLIHFQSDAESDILHFIHENGPSVDGFLINPAGLTYFGLATRDALLDSNKPYVEVHFANLSVWKQNTAPGRSDLQSMFTHTSSRVIEGLRHYGYFAGILALAMALDDESFLGAPAGD